MPKPLMPTRIPVTLLTGDLGAGKTTLARRILAERRSERVVFIQNELADVAVEDGPVVELGARVEITGGRLCCTARAELIRVLDDQIWAKRACDRIVIEMAGITDPAPVIQTLLVDQELSAYLKLDAIIAVVDAETFRQHVDRTRELQKQITHADAILLNKIDLVPPAEREVLRTWLRSMNRSAWIQPTQRCAVALSEVLQFRAFELSRALKVQPSFLSRDAHVHEQTIGIVTIDLPGEVDPERWSTWIRKLLADRGADILRSKGIASLQGQDRQFVFQSVHGGLDASLGRAWGGSERRNRMVFIGRRLSRKRLLSGLKRCFARPHPVG